MTVRELRQFLFECDDQDAQVTQELLAPALPKPDPDNFRVVTGDAHDALDMVDDLLEAAAQGYTNANYPDHGYSDMVVLLTPREITADEAQALWEAYEAELAL